MKDFKKPLKLEMLYDIASHANLNFVSPDIKPKDMTLKEALMFALVRANGMDVKGFDYQPGEDYLERVSGIDLYTNVKNLIMLELIKNGAAYLPLNSSTVYLLFNISLRISRRSI